MDRAALANRLAFIQKLIDETTFEFSQAENSEEFLDELSSASLCLDDALDIVDRDIAYKEYLRQVASSSPAKEG